MNKIDELPRYTCSGEPFIPGKDPCFAVLSEVAWAEGNHGFSTYTTTAIRPAWDSKKHAWRVPDAGGCGSPAWFLHGFYATKESAEPARLAAEKGGA